MGIRGLQRWKPWLLFAPWLTALACAAQVQDLGGDWRHQRDPDDRGVVEGWPTRRLAERVKIPAAKPGSAWSARELKGTRTENGAASWYARDVTIPGWWQGSRVVLRLGACVARVQVWIDGTALGEGGGTGTVAEFELTDSLAPGTHRLALRVDPRGDSIPPFSSVEARATGKVWIGDVHVVPDAARRRASVTVTVRNRLAGQGDGTLTLRARGIRPRRSKSLPEARHEFAIGFGETRRTVEYDLGGAVPAGAERRSTEYELTVALAGLIGDRTVADEWTIPVVLPSADPVPAGP